MKVKKGFGIIAAAVSTVLFLLCGCMTTSITNLDIRDIKAVLKNKNGNIVTSVIPGEKYTLTVTIIDMKGRTINHPSTADLILESSDQTFMNIKKSLFDMHVTGTLYTIVFTQLPGYSLTIKIKDNPFKKTICWPVNWDEFTILNFTGMPGKKGIDGQDGLDGAPSFAVADGDDGADGWDGEDGKNGKDATILVLSYNVENMDIDGITDNTMLFIADITNKKEYLFMRKPVIIDASGGNGGEGGKGGDAGAGAEYSEYDGTMTEIIKGKDGEPGTGGNGGKGGNGGNIHLLYVQDTVLPLITVITTGGTGGKAGEHGETAGYGSIWHRGVNFDGRPGKDGQYTKKKISPDKARAICGFIENRYFEPGNILLE